MSQGSSDLKRELLPIQQTVVENKYKLRKLSLPNLGFLNHQSVHGGKSRILTKNIRWKIQQKDVLLLQRSGNGPDQQAQDQDGEEGELEEEKREEKGGRETNKGEKEKEDFPEGCLARISLDTL